MDLAKIRNKSKKNYKSQGISFSLIEVIIVIMISILFGGLVGSLVTLSRGNVTDEYLEEFYATYNDIVSDYYKKLDKNKLIDAAIEGMVNYLDDPYSTFMNSEETEDFNTTVNGEYKGIGITIGMVNEKPTVVDMFLEILFLKLMINLLMVRVWMKLLSLLKIKVRLN